MNKFILNLFFLLGLAIFMTSCSDDTVRGCTTVGSINYDANATEDDGSCQFERDAFLGNYIGDFACPGVLVAASTEGLEFSIIEPVDPANTSGATISFNSGIISGVSVEGVVSGNELTIPNQERNGFPFMGVTVDLMFSGNFTLDGNKLTGDLDVVINSAFINDEDSCTLDAVKQ